MRSYTASNNPTAHRGAPRAHRRAPIDSQLHHAELDQQLRPQNAVTPQRIQYSTPTIELSTFHQANDKECYIATISHEDQLFISRKPFTPALNIRMDSDSRAKRMGLVLPKPNFLIPGLSPAVHATCTFYGGSCYSCNSDVEKHSINDSARCFILGDEFCPILAGLNTDCCPTMRLQGASFYDLKMLLMKQVSAGLRIKKGSIGIILLHTHLVKIGYSTYWSQLISFTEWAASLNLNILPCIPPFPAGLDMSHLISIKQLYTHLQVGNFGKATGSKNEAYSLWSVLTSTLKKLGVNSGMISAPPISIPEAGFMYASCEGQFFLGCDGDWTSGTPRAIEETFLLSLVDALSSVKDLISPTVNLKLPSEDSIKAGVKASPTSDMNSGKSIYVLGTSIMQDIKPHLQDLCQPKGVQVISCCKSGKFLEYISEQDLGFMKSSNNDDILFISFLGNELLKKQSHWADFQRNGRRCFHLLHPSTLNDEDMDSLLARTNLLINALRLYFKGRIFMIGAFPRHLEACCGLQDHAILDQNNQRLSMLGYTNLFNLFLQNNLELPDGTEFLDYQQIIGTNTFNSSSLVDGVHLSSRFNKSCANFFLGAFKRKLRGKRDKVKGEAASFTKFLENKGLLSNKNTSTSSNYTTDNAMDDAINLIL